MRRHCARTFGASGAYVFAISVTATIILISSLSSLLYHWGVLQKVVAAMAWVMMKTMRTSGSESLAGASNIFLGQTEAALLIKPYLLEDDAERNHGSDDDRLLHHRHRRDGGLCGHGRIKRRPHPDRVGPRRAGGIAHLESDVSRNAKRARPATRCHFEVKRTAQNSIDALCQGASEGVMLSINVMGMLIAFVAVVALLNGLIVWPQHALGLTSPLTIQQMLGWLNAPFAWLMGVPWKDCPFIGQILGERIVLNEFVGYLNLSDYVKAHPDALDPRSVTLASYALCGFANFSSIAIQIGGIGALAPERRGDLARLGLRSMIAGLIACYLFAAVVGVLI